MPRSQPFTALCQLAARGRHAGRADLHTHTTHSDGSYSPTEVVDLARRLGLSAIAVTDHDTLGAVPAARAAASGTGVEVVSGVEITAEYRGREVHLLGHFVDPDDPALGAALARVRRGRAERYAAMVGRLRAAGVPVPEGQARPGGAPDAWGRRHLAELLVHCGQAGSVREAFARYLHDGAPAAVPKPRLPAAEAVALVRGAGGVAGWAHPPYDCTREALAELHGLGLGSVEAEYPGVRRGRAHELRAWAAALGLAVTAGSDCHGPGPRALGSHTVSAAELAALRPGD
jgi:predicted metal-dependent phosphoesterase TrpH